MPSTNDSPAIQESSKKPGIHTGWLIVISIIDDIIYMCIYICVCYIICIYIYVCYISADPACSRGSASEEELPAARAKKSLQAARARSKKTRKKKQEQEAIPAGPVRPSGPCCLAVAQAPFWVRQLGFLVGSESHVRHSRPWLAGPVRLSGPGCLAVAQAPFWVRQLGFLVGSESNVRHSRPWPAGPVRPSGPCCFGVASAPCVSFGGGKTGRGGRGLQARSVPQGPAVSVWRRRRL